MFLCKKLVKNIISSYLNSLLLSLGDMKGREILLFNFKSFNIKLSNFLMALVLNKQSTHIFMFFIHFY